MKPLEKDLFLRDYYLSVPDPDYLFPVLVMVAELLSPRTVRV